MRFTAIFAAVLLAAGTASAAEPIGAASIVQGSAKLRRGGPEAGWTTLKPGDAVFQGDRVRTESGTVRLTFNDKSSLSLSPRSELELNEFVYKPKSARRSFFSLWSGKMKAKVSKVLQGDSDVRVATPTAVAGVRGTEFIVGLETQDGKPVPENAKPEDLKTDVTVISGKVAVKSALKEIAKEIALEAGQSSTVGFKKAPGDVVALTPQALRAAQRATTVRSGGSLRSSVGGSQLQAASADIEQSSNGLDNGAGGPQLGTPPIQQQPTDANQGSTLTIKVRIPEQQ